MHIQLQENGTYWRHIRPLRNFAFGPNHLQPPETLTAQEAEMFRVYPLTLTTRPAVDETTHGLRESTPVQVAGVWTQQWEVYPLPAEEAAANLARRAEEEALRLKSKVEALWAAADKYTGSYISGVAIGILTIGVMQQKPKALAVSDWSSSVWAEYYRRKALVTLDSVDDHDFSSFGPIPHSVPELQAEVGR